MTSSPFFVHGVELVGTGAMCEACGVRKAIGSSIKGHLLCPRCAGMAAVMAEEYAVEVEAARERLDLRRAEIAPKLRKVAAMLERPIADHSRRSGDLTRERADAMAEFRCGHARTPTNTYLSSQGRRQCRECRRARSTEAKRRVRQREARRLAT